MSEYRDIENEQCDARKTHDALIVTPEYQSLNVVLTQALEQAQNGKGKDRHAAGEMFEQQEICQNTRAVGYGYPLGQARKKARESLRLLQDKGPDAAIAECLGAINYLAAAVIVMEEERLATQKNTERREDMKKDDVETMLRKFYGLPPFDIWSNPCVGDGIYAKSIANKYALREINAVNRQPGKPEWK